jgi:hypothetical protein
LSMCASGDQHQRANDNQLFHSRSPDWFCCGGTQPQ